MTHPGATERAAPDRRCDLVLWLVATVVVLWALGDYTFHGSEDRWAEVTREMFLRRDFFHPTINAYPYFDKPLLGYWLVALTSLVTGRLDEWAVRLPGALCGLVALAATVRLGRRLWSPTVGRTAGWVLLTTYGFLWWARRGEADMENLAAIMTAIAWYWSRRERPTFTGYLVFYLLCFVGAHAKGLAAVAVPAIALLPDVLRGRRWRMHLRPANALALGLGLLVYLGPFLYATATRGGYGESGLALVFRENVQRYVAPFDHAEPFWVYCGYLPELFLPWVPLLLVALAALAPALRRPYGADRWLAEAIVLVFAFFTLSGSRRLYYILPMLPLCALATALLLADRVAWQAWRRRALRLQTIGLGAAIVVAIVAPLPAALVARRLDFPLDHDVAILVPLLALVALVPWMVERRQAGWLGEQLGLPRTSAPLLASTALVAAGAACCMIGRFDQYRTRAPFARALGALARREPAAAIAFLRAPGEDVLFYGELPVPVHMFVDAGAMTRFLGSHAGHVLVVVQQRDAPTALAALPPSVRHAPVLAEPARPWEGHRRASKLAVWRVDGTAGESLAAAGRAP